MSILPFFLILVVSLFPRTAISSNSIMCGDLIMCLIGTPCNDSINCTENSFCDDETKVCTCSPGFKETSYNMCLADYQSDCSTSACNEEAQLVCNRSTNGCECALKGTHYSVPQGKCVASAGTDCSKTFGCTDNAFCNAEIDWKCYCNGGFSRTNEGRCLLGFDRICNSSYPEDEDNEEEDYLYKCNSDAFLRCNNDKCVCETETDFIYDDELEECVSLVDGKCDFKVTVGKTKILKCAKGSECVDNGEYGICRCRNGREVDESRKCVTSNAIKIQQSNHFFLISCILLILSTLTCQ